jgi:hypothetical protein
MARAARAARLDFIVSTEHAERAFARHTERNLALLRRRFPGLIVLFGIEWNLPAAGHATVMVEQWPGEVDLLKEFTKLFDRKVAPDMRNLDQGVDGQSWGSFEQALAGLGWLRRLSVGDLPPRTVVYLNHPAKNGYLSASQIARLHDAGLAGVEGAPGHQNAGLAGVEGAPGHQKWDPPGIPRSIDRHDPYIAVIGGDHDRLLGEGRALGLIASSDFHTLDTAYYPGVFSRTLVYCPERSPRGVVDGLLSGSTATVMGGVASAMDSFVTVRGFADSARIGETLTVPLGSEVTYSLRIEVPEWDFQGAPNRIDEVEIISDWTGHPAVVQTFRPVDNGRLQLAYTLPRAACERPHRFFLRARGRRFIGGPGHDLANADYLFYVGATLIEVVGPSADMSWP